MLNTLSYIKRIGVCLFTLLLSLLLLIGASLFLDNIWDNLNYANDILDSKDCVRYIDNENHTYNNSVSLINNAVNIFNPKLNVYIPSYFLNNNIINENYIINNTITSYDTYLEADLTELKYKHEIAKLHTEMFINTLVKVNKVLLENTDIIDRCANIFSS